MLIIVHNVFIDRGSMVLEHILEIKQVYEKKPLGQLAAEEQHTKHFGWQTLEPSPSLLDQV